MNKLLNSVTLLALVVVIVVICATILALNGKPIPDWFAVLAGALVGGSAGIALPGGTTPANPTQPGA